MTETQVKDLENTSRIVRNIQNLVSDSEIKGNMAMAVAEAIGFLDAFQKNLEQALDNGRFELKKQATSKQLGLEVVDAEVVIQPSIGQEGAVA